MFIALSEAGFHLICVVDFDQVFRAVRREKRVGAFEARVVLSER